MGSRQDAKNEKALKELLKLPGNRRCFNCENLGPQYVVSNFNIFVCTTCSGIHREFGHRVKGISMSTFKTEEVEALKQQGNEYCSDRVLAKWTSSALPKPTDRSALRIKDWIRAVFTEQRFAGEPATKPVNEPAKPFASDAKSLPLFRSPSANGTGMQRRDVRRTVSAASPGTAVVERKLSDVLGSDTPKLMVAGSAAVSPVQSPPKQQQHRKQPSMDLLGGSLSPIAAASPAAAPSGQAPSDVAAASLSAAHPPQELTWAVFDEVAPAAPAAASFNPSLSPEVPPPAVASPTKWEAFGDEPAALNNDASDGAKVAPAPSAAEITPEPVAKPKPVPRPEVPLDVFYPEFEQIRATGVLPNGQPLPPPGYPLGGAPYNPALAALAMHQRGAAAATTSRQLPAAHTATASSNPFAGPSPGVAASPNSFAGHGAGAPAPPNPYAPLQPQRPTVVLSGHGGSPGWGTPSPVRPTDSGNSSSGARPAYLATPSSSAGAPQQQVGWGVTAAQQQQAWYSPASSTASLSPATGARPQVTPATAPDVFSGLAGSLRGALPGQALSPAKSAENGAGLGLTSVQASTPLTANGGPPPAVNGDGAVMTLFGRTPSYYDLTAPAAPQPAASGNPFA